MSRTPNLSDRTGRPRRPESIRLHCNENPYGPPPGAVAAAEQELRSAGQSYPDSDCTQLRQRIAEFHDVRPDMVAVGNGADELVLLTAMAFLKPGTPVVLTDSTFPGYASAARSVGADIRSIPLADHAIPATALSSALTDEVALTYVCNPHNPTGSVLRPSEVLQILDRAEDRNVIPVFDEAYMEFAGPDHECALDAVRAGRRLLVLRTFSKAWGLAGLRVGYLIGHHSLVAEVLRARQPLPFSVNRLALRAAEAALDHPEHIDDVRARTAAARDLLCERLAALGVATTRSATNFVLARPPGNSNEIATRLVHEHDVHVRDLSMFGLPGHLRITVGTPEQVAALGDALESILPDSAARSDLSSGLGAPDGRIEVATRKPLDHINLFNGYVGATVVFALNELGAWPPLLSGVQRVDALAEKLGVERGKLLVLLRVAALLGHVELHSATAPADPGTGSTVALSPAGRELVRHRGFFTWGIGGYHQLLHGLADIALGKAAFGEDIPRDGAKVATGAGMVGSELMAPVEREVFADIDFDSVADLGCGDATRLIRMCSGSETRRGVGIDVDDGACEEAVKAVADSGLSHRVDIVRGDVLQHMGGRTFPGVELVTSFLMMHDLFEASGDPAGTMRTLRELFPDAKWFLIGDTVGQRWDDPAAELPIFSMEFELVHAFMDTPIATAQAYETAFAAADLRIHRREPFGAPSTWLWLLAAD
ncbi:aminotransferase class I/II-fold pyridoxal phosphate-dependent enzyme [Saccharopolyspora sp. NPDC000359]|uniref:aminotransferase class I/II-fold pyridoxal phosphate-dependent enzyme n=1 Tax=Saccharopolyspora sp. NPDC000359 TaxID=3154251 RepID=UPI00332F6D77